ncbi:Flp pilus assembly protein CpaB [Elusimicrobium posterum]|uniref:hypothetical protein n=1 Tax=Elusimicrobium posterum TaxID=3116653 RepID=UPI003C738DE3
MNKKIISLILISAFSPLCYGASFVTKNVVVATRDIPAPLMLKLSDMEIKEVTNPADHYIEAQSAQELEQYTEYFTLADIKKGEQIKNNFITKVPETYMKWRYYTLPVGEESALMFFNLKEKLNQNIDIMSKTSAQVRQPDGSAKEETIVFTILQRIRVLSVLEEGGSYALLIVVDPRDAGYLFLAQKDSGGIKVVLRPPAENGIYPLKIASSRDFEKEAEYDNN